jgi:antitoxin (DNA-binding transcriptional repressor) of toxin-antitoxin stability system
MSTYINVSEARATLPQLLDRVRAGEEITITRHGQPAAVLIRPEALRARRADKALVMANVVRDALDLGRQSPLSARPALRRARADSLIAEIRAGRSSP